MRSFIVVTFLLLGWGFWIASGGAAFVPEAWPEAEAAPPEVAAAPPGAPIAGAALLPPAPVIARADLDLVAPQAPEDAPADAPAPDAAIAESVAAALAAVAAPPEPGPAADLREVTADLVNLRQGPGTEFRVVGQLAGGAVAEVLETEGEWARVRDAAGTSAWMAARFLASP